MNNKIEDRIKDIMSAVFEISTDEINGESSPDNIVLWDSLKHMNLVFALEEEFGISINEEEMINMKSYDEIRNFFLTK